MLTEKQKEKYIEKFKFGVRDYNATNNSHKNSKVEEFERIFYSVKEMGYIDEKQRFSDNYKQNLKDYVYNQCNQHDTDTKNGIKSLAADINHATFNFNLELMEYALPGEKLYTYRILNIKFYMENYITINEIMKDCLSYLVLGY